LHPGPWGRASTSASAPSTKLYLCTSCVSSSGRHDSRHLHHTSAPTLTARLTSERTLSSGRLGACKSRPSPTKAEWPRMRRGPASAPPLSLALSCAVLGRSLLHPATVRGHEVSAASGRFAAAALCAMARANLAHRPAHARHPQRSKRTAPGHESPSKSVSVAVASFGVISHCCPPAEPPPHLSESDG